MIPERSSAGSSLTVTLSQAEKSMSRWNIENIFCQDCLGNKAVKKDLLFVDMSSKGGFKIPPNIEIEIDPIGIPPENHRFSVEHEITWNVYAGSSWRTAE